MNFIINPSFGLNRCTYAFFEKIKNITSNILRLPFSFKPKVKPDLTCHMSIHDLLLVLTGPIIKLCPLVHVDATSPHVARLSATCHHMIHQLVATSAPHESLQRHHPTRARRHMAQSRMPAFLISGATYFCGHPPAVGSCHLSQSGCLV